MTQRHFRKATAAHNATQYDVAIMGGGLSAILLAYRLQKNAADEGRDAKILLLADRVNSPALAGTQIVRGIEGFFEPGQKQPENVDRLLREGQDWLENTIKNAGIECRLSQGYEIKGLSAEQLDARRQSNEAKNIYRRGEIVDNTDSQTLNLAGYPASVRMDCAGQVNAPELLDGLLNEYKKLGGTVVLDEKYLDHSYNDRNGAVIETTAGRFQCKTKPVIATGAKHMAGMNDFPVESDIVYTMAMTIGPMREEDARAISKGPVAFCNVTDDQNMIWGSIDSKNMLTLGYGELTGPAGRAALEKELRGYLEEFFPGLADKYPPKTTFDGIMYTPNLMPVVGETERSYLMTG